MSSQRCVMAYSGGLDTSSMLPWLIERGYEVHAVLVDVGQEENLPELLEKAKRYGAASAVVRDARAAMEREILPGAIGLAAVYEGAYRLGTALARPFIAREQVARARELGGATLVHGATGKGNDQIRFEFAYRSLAPDMPILAPWKVWDLTGRVAMVDFLRSKGFSDSYEVQKDFSLDENLWHLSVEGGPLEDPAVELDVGQVLAAIGPRFCWSERGQSPPQRVMIHSEQGIPTAVDGASAALLDLVHQLNHRFRRAHWAWDLVIENRFTGIKSRGLYINPAARLLHTAIDALAQACLNQPSYQLWRHIGGEWASAIYRGEFFSPQRRALDAAAAPLLQALTGSVTLATTPRLYAARVDAPNALFTRQMSTFEQSDFDHADADGYIKLSWLRQIGRPESDSQGGSTTRH